MAVGLTINCQSLACALQPSTGFALLIVSQYPAQLDCPFNIFWEHIDMSTNPSNPGLARPLRPWPFFSSAVYAGSRTKPLPPEVEADNEEGLALPVEPDEGTPLIPDDERVINVPS